MILGGIFVAGFFLLYFPFDFARQGFALAILEFDVDKTGLPSARTKGVSSDIRFYVNQFSYLATYHLPPLSIHPCVFETRPY